MEFDLTIRHKKIQYSHVYDLFVLLSRYVIPSKKFNIFRVTDYLSVINQHLI